MNPLSFRSQKRSGPLLSLIRKAHADMASYMLNPHNRLYAVMILIFLAGNLFQAVNRSAIIDGSDLNGYLESAVAAKYLDVDVYEVYRNNSFSAFFYVVMLFFSLFATWLGSLLWAMANVAFYLWSIVVTNDILFRTQPGREKLNVFVAPILTFALFATNIHMGQSNHIILVCMLISLYYLHRNAHVKPALFLAFAIAYKLTPAFLVFYLLLKRKFRTALYTVVFTLLFLIVVPMFFYTPQKSIDFFASWSSLVIEPFFSGQKVQTTNTGYYHTNQSLDAFLNRHFTPYGTERYGGAHHVVDFPVLSEAGAHRAGIVIKLVIIGLLALVALKKRTIHSRLFPFEFSLFLIAILFISPSSWPSHYILILPAYILVVNEIIILPKGRHGRNLLTWSLGLGTAIMLLGWGPYLQSFSFYFIGVFFFFNGLLIYTLFFAGKAERFEGSDPRRHWLGRSGPAVKQHAQKEPTNTL